MLPPKKIPQGLGGSEYVKLQVRYTSIGWARQGLLAASLALKHNQAPSNLSEQARLRTSAIFSALDKLLIFNEVSDDVKRSVKDLCELGLSEADKSLDQFQNVKKAKDGLKTIIAMVSQTVHDTIDDSLEHHVLPALGMPLDRIPAGKSHAEYYNIARRYRQIGACEPARECLKEILNEDKESELGKKAALYVRTQLPKRTINHEVMLQYMSAQRLFVTGKAEQGKALLRELEVKHPSFEWPLVGLANLELKDGNAERTRHLLDEVIKLNPNLVAAWCAKARLSIGEWRLNDLDYCFEKAQILDPDDSAVKGIKDLIKFINEAGLRT